MKLKRNILPNAFIFLSFLEGLAVGGLKLGGIGGVDYMFQFQKLKFIDIFTKLLFKNKRKTYVSGSIGSCSSMVSNIWLEFLYFFLKHWK